MPSSADQNDDKKWFLPELEQIRNEYLAAATGRMTTAEITETFSNLEALLTGEAYYRLSTSQTSGGYPSPNMLMALSPSLRKKQLTTLAESADQLELDIEEMLDNLADKDPKTALPLVEQLMRGATGDLMVHLSKVKAHAQKRIAELKEHEKLPTMKSPKLAPTDIDPKDQMPDRPGRKRKKVARMGQNPGDDVFTTGDKS